MVEVIVIPDGAAEDPRPGLTSLERAHTPTLDALCAEGEVRHRCTIPAGLPAGSEVGIPTVLGVQLADAPARGLIEAAAAGIAVADGMWAWRVDASRDNPPACVPDGLLHLRGHRFLAIAREAPRLWRPWRVWPAGAALPRALDDSTIVVGAPGAAVGCALLLGARARVPEGVTGDARTDLRAKAASAIALLDEATRVVVHVAAPDEASHERDPVAKIAALEAIDRLVIAPLADAITARGGALVVCPDHGTDPATGEHLREPVPMLRWGQGITPSGPSRLTERALLEALIR